MTFVIYGISLHLYGLIMGLAITVAWLLVNQVINQQKIIIPGRDLLWVMVVLGGMLGARIWHIVTDWYLYQDHLISTLFIWQGGLSIIGAVVGGWLTLCVLKLVVWKELNLWVVSDLLVFGLPVGQSIGRIGNYVNQELFGLPTHLPWGISIDKIYLPDEYLLMGDALRFHPLFLYEILVLVMIAIVVWKFNWRVGSGNNTLFYLMAYIWSRWMLDFLRIDRGRVVMGLGINQWFLLIVGLLIGSFVIFRLVKKLTFSNSNMN